MRWYVYGLDAQVAAWVKERLPHAEFGPYKAVGLAENKKLIAGVVYHGWIQAYGNIELSIAADVPTWATPAAIQRFLWYPFRELRCRRVTACVPASNKRALRFLYGIGFQKEGVIRQGYGKEDAVICGMVYKEAKKWLNRSNNGKKVHTVTAPGA